MWGAGAVREMGFPALGWRFRGLSGVLGPLAFDDVPGSGLDSCLPAVFGGVVFGCAGLGLVFGVGVAWDGRSPPPGFVVVSSASPGSGKRSPGRVPGHRTGGQRICFSVAWRPVSGSRFRGTPRSVWSAIPEGILKGKRIRKGGSEKRMISICF